MKLTKDQMKKLINHYKDDLCNTCIDSGFMNQGLYGGCDGSYCEDVVRKFLMDDDKLYEIQKILNDDIKIENKEV